MVALTSDRVVEIAVRHLETWRESGQAKVGGLTTHADERHDRVLATHLAFLGVIGERYSKQILREAVLAGLFVKLEAAGAAVQTANMQNSYWMPEDPDGTLYACVISSSTASFDAGPGSWIWEMVRGGLATITTPKQLQRQGGR